VLRFAVDVMESVPGAVATGSQLNMIQDRDHETRSLPLPVLTSSSKSGHHLQGADVFDLSKWRRTMPCMLTCIDIKQGEP
jgi:hypothetical protein